MATTVAPAWMTSFTMCPALVFREEDEQSTRASNASRVDIYLDDDDETTLSCILN